MLQDHHGYQKILSLRISYCTTCSRGQIFKRNRQKSFVYKKKLILVQKTKLLGSDKIPVLILNTEHGLKTFFIAKLNIID